VLPRNPNDLLFRKPLPLHRPVLLQGETPVQSGKVRGGNVSSVWTEAATRLDKRCRETTGFSLFDFRPQAYGAGVSVPTLMAQLRRDFLIHGEKDG
jgi:hypothetical protein